MSICVSRPLLLGAVLLFASCSSSKLQDVLPPADSNTPKVAIALVFNNYLYDTVANRHDKSLYFDGVQNRAVRVDVRIFTVNPTNGVVRDSYPIQSFDNGKDFQNGNPNYLQVNIPKSGGFVMEVTVYGEKDADCCPGPPVGRPVFRSTWPYGEYGGVPKRANLPKKIECLSF